MKKRIALLLLPLAALLYFPCCVSCTDTNPDDPVVIPEPKPDPKPEEPEKPGTGNYTVVFPEQTGTSKTGWEEGDQIFFHGNYGPNAQTITLKAADITDGGKSATVALNEALMELQCAPDGIYAVYPAQAVKAYDSLMDSDVEFTEWDRVLMMSYLKEGSFAFRCVTAVLNFTVSGDYDSYAICGTDREGIRVAGFRADYTSQKQSIDGFTSDGYPFREGAVTDGNTTLFLPGGLSFKKGFTLFLGKDGVFPKVYTHEAVEILPGDVLDLGDITGALADYDGPAPKMPEMGERTKFTVKFNELSGLCLSADADFLWAIDDNGVLGKLSFTGEVLYKKSLGIDPEAVTLEPSGDLLVGNEEPCSVYRVAAPDFNKATKLFTIPGTSGFGNAGMEGLTYYKEGLVLSGMQTGSWLFCCEVDGGNVVWKKEVRKIFPAITEIAGLCYDPLTDWLWVIDSESHQFFALTITGDPVDPTLTMLARYKIGGTDNPESISVDHVHSCIWVGDDYGSTSYLYRYDFTGLDDAILAEK